jgi:hypothetical protein
MMDDEDRHEAQVKHLHQTFGQLARGQDLNVILDAAKELIEDVLGHVCLDDRTEMARELAQEFEEQYAVLCRLCDEQDGRNVRVVAK